MSQSACILPLSWTKFHLPQLISRPSLVGEAKRYKDTYGQCLITLIDSFIKLVSHLDELRGFRYTYGARWSKIEEKPYKVKTFGQGIQERNRNFLVIALINLSAMNYQLPGSSKVSESAWKVSARFLLSIRLYNH
jgi:hypothetical protein